MKQRWINSRIKLLHQILPKQKNSQMGRLVEDFMLRLQPEYPEKIGVEYKRSGDKVIPLGMGETLGRPIPMPWLSEQVKMMD